MSDPAKLSDTELMAALNAGAPPASGVADMSDADLLKALGQPAPPAEQPSVIADVAKSGGSGVVRGVTGLIGAIPDMAVALGDARDRYLTNPILEKLGLPTVDLSKANPASVVGAQSLNRGIDTLTGLPVTSYKPQTIAGQYARTVGEFLPGAMAGPGGAARNALAYALVPGVASEAAGQATAGTAAEPVARLAAALVSTMGPAALNRAITPLPVSPERQKMIDVLTREGVPLTAGQRSGSTPLQYAESIFGDAPLAGGKSGAAMERQAEAFTNAAMSRAGGAGRATPENVAANYDRLTNEFRTLSARNTLQADVQLGQDIGATLREYDKVLPSEQRKIIGNMATDIIDRLSAGSGTMKGTDYQTIRSRLSKRAQNARGNDNDLADAYRGLRNALDDAMTRSVSQADAEAWGLARRQWGNQKVLESAASAAGEKAAAGLISPANLRTAAVSGKNRGAYARGEGDFSELARSGAGLMTPLPNSGTGQRNMLSGAGGGGAVAAALSGNFPLAAALMFGPGIAGRALYSKPVQSYLGNQARAGQDIPSIEKLAQALLAGRSATLPTAP